MGSATAPKPVAAAAAAAPAPAPAGSGSADPAAARARTLDPKRIITATSFGPYRTGEKVTRKLLQKKFGMKFESEPVRENPEDGGWTSAMWRAEVSATTGAAGLTVTQDGTEWRVEMEGFYDARGIGVGATAAQLIAAIPDLACENMPGEEPMFECWSPAAPNLRYGGGHSYTLEDNFTKQQLAASDLTVDYLDWQPPKQ